MPRLSSLQRRAVAIIAAAFALCGPSTAAAQTGGFVPSEEDAILLQLQVGTHRLTNDLRGYQTPSGICVDLADVIQSLDLPVRLDKKSRRATGWIFAEDQTFTLDRESNTVQIVNNHRSLQPGEVVDTPEGWCVDTRTLGGWFNVSLTPNLRNAALVLASDQPLPFVEAIERQSRAARLRPERSPDLTGYPVAPQPYSLWRTPSVDFVARADYRSDRGRSHLNTKYEILASGEVARASFEARLASDGDGVPDSLRLRAYRMDPDGGLLGPLHATQAVVGDVDMLSGNLAGATGVGRGVFLSNRQLQQADRFGTTVLRGELPLGWDAELYRNGQLLAFQSNRPDGRYEFEVNLLFGNNLLEVVMYGPQGQIRRETQSVPVGAGALEPGKIEYWAGIIERNHDLISFGRPPPIARFDGGWQYAAGVQYGLDRRTVIGASAHSLFIDRRRRDYAELNLQRSIGAMLLNFTAAQEFGRGRAYSADLLAQFGKFNVQAHSLVVEGPFVSGWVDANEKGAHSVIVDTTVNLGRLPLPLAAGFSRTSRRDGREVNEFLMRASLLMPRFAITGFVLHRDAAGYRDDEEGTEVGLLANTRLLGVSARGEATYRVTGPHTGFDTVNLTLEKSLGEHSDVRLDIEHRGLIDRTEFELGYVHHFRRVDLRASAQADTRGGVGGNLALSFSLGPDPLGGGWRMSSEKLARRGQAAVSVFLDANGDGVRSAEEEALPGVEVTAGRSGTGAPTDEQGHTFVEALQPFQKVLISVDESTLPDPYLMPRGRGVVVTPRPGVAAVIELAVAPTGEVEGVLNGPEGTPLGGAMLELVDAAGQVMARTLSEFDGFFLFDRVSYGSYRLQLSPDNQAALGASPELAGAIEVGADKPVARVGTVRLRAATTIAQARGPPTGSSP
jgi:hypothetical protein